MSASLYQRYERHAPAPHTRFLITPDGVETSYGELFAAAGRYAAVLAAAGVEPGDRVAVQTAKSVESLFLYLGCLRIGAVSLPLNPAYTPAEVAYILGDAEPRVFVCDPVDIAGVEPTAARAGVAAVMTLAADGSGSLPAAAAASGETAPVVDRAADDLAAILYTSGTTGRSKGAMLTHGNLTSNAATLVEYWRIDDADVLLHALPIFHTHGLFVAIGTTLLAGASMIYLPRFEVDQVMRSLKQATTFMGVPTFYARLLSRPDFGRELTGHMRLFVSGSAPLSAESHGEFLARTGHAILERYGMTETNMNTSNPYDGERRPATVGLPLPGVEVRITDPTSGDALPTGEVGMIEVRGPNVCAGYWRNPEKTRDELRANGFFITGDLGSIDGRGYVSIVGRSKDLIISGGLNVYPAEVEAALDAVPGVAESAVIGVPHADFGEAVAAVVAPRGGSTLAEDDIVGALEPALAKFKLPKRVLIVDSLPRNTIGKVQKAALRETYKALFSQVA